MSANPLFKVLSAVPVNRQARLIVGQAGCVDSPDYLTRDELSKLQERLRRKHTLLKHILQIKTKAQHVNLLRKVKKGEPNFRVAKNQRAVNEYVRCGTEIQRLAVELAIDRKCRQAAYAAEMREPA